MRQTGQRTQRLTSVPRAPLRQYKRCLGIAFLLAGLIPARRPPRPVSAGKPYLPLSLAGMALWSRTALWRPRRVSHTWRCAQQQPPVAYFPPAKPLQQQEPPSTTQLFGSARPKRRILKGLLQLHPPDTTAVSGEIDCLLPPPTKRVIETKSGQNRMFDQGGS